MFEKTFHYKDIASPVGMLRLVASDKGLCSVLFEDGKHNRVMTKVSLERNDTPILQKAERQLGEYFASQRRQFDLKLDMQGTIFQITAWRELQKIPYGNTISYGEQATRVGDVKKARAVGMANGRNPLAIIVPCHRVIGASGALVGFASGLAIKQHLLDLERKHAA